MTIPQTVRDEWNQLRLEILIALPLRDHEWAAIADFRQAISMRGPHLTLTSVLPLTPAKLQENYRGSILDCAKAHGEDEPRSSYMSGRYKFPIVKEWGDAYRRDITKINKALFGFDLCPSTELEIGFYKNPRFERLHRDSTSDKFSPGPAGVGYMMRVGALPFQTISAKHVRQASPEGIELIKSATEETAVGKTARDLLVEKATLQPFPLDHVALIAIGRDGTLHSSSPERNAPSAFFMGGRRLPGSAPVFWPS